MGKSARIQAKKRVDLEWAHGGAMSEAFDKWQQSVELERTWEKIRVETLQGVQDGSITPNKILSISSDAKTVKGEKNGILTAICYMLPADSSGITLSKTGTLLNLCPYASPACSEVCLVSAGRGSTAFDGALNFAVRKARLIRTAYWHYHPEKFNAQLQKESDAAKRKAKRQDMRLAVRLNGTTDIMWERVSTVIQDNPETTFYDYSKIPQRFRKNLPENYSLTFSRSETNEAELQQNLDNGRNVAVVFSTRKGQPLPDTYEVNGKNYAIIDGDESDDRTRDPKGVIVGLRAKGDAKHDTSGFVVQVQYYSIENQQIAFV